MYGDKDMIAKVKNEIRDLNILAEKLKRERGPISKRMKIHNKICELEFVLENMERGRQIF